MPKELGLKTLEDIKAETDLARDKAARWGLSFYVWAGVVVVLDGGKRAGQNGWLLSGDGNSFREATEQEQRLWDVLP